MELSRREAIGLSAAFAAIASQLDPAAYAQAVANEPRAAGSVDVANYWSRFYDDTVITKGVKGLAKESRKTLYLHAVDSGKPLQYADTIPVSELPAIEGDVRVRMAVSQFRPGSGDVSTDVSHLRIDAAQSFDYMNLVAPLSWAAIASFTPDKQISKLPTIDQLGYNASADAAGTNLKEVTLPGGVGKLAVNVTRPANGTFTQIVKSASTIVNTSLSMMTLPAISVPAIKVVTELFGKWQSHATVIMNGYLTPVIATSKPAQMPLPQDPMALRNGYYIMFPEQHKNELASQFDQLTVMKGFLVPKNARGSADLPTLAKSAVPGVSYATLRVYVDKAPVANCATGKPA